MFLHTLLFLKHIFNDCGYATETEVEHVGINRFLNKIRTLTIPPRNKAALSVYGENGWISATGQTIPLSVFRSRPDNLPYIPNSMKNDSDEPLLKINRWRKSGKWDYNNQAGHSNLAACLLGKCSRPGSTSDKSEYDEWYKSDSERWGPLLPDLSTGDVSITKVFL